MTVSESKKQLRALVRARERQLPEEYRSDCARRITRLVMDLPEYRQARCVFCFVGTRREIDTTALLRDILAGGKRLCVPLCVGDGIMQLKEITALEQLSPRGLWHPGAPGERGDRAAGPGGPIHHPLPEL